MSVPFSSFPIPVNAPWLQINLGLNGDWGTDTATAYIDSLRLTPIPEPGVFAILGLGVIGLALRRRRG